MKTNTRACRQCRQGKRRCDGPVGETCLPCHKRDLACSAAFNQRPNHALRAAESSNNSSLIGTLETRNALASTDHKTVMEVVELYIEYIHDKPHSLFHVPTLRDDVAARNIYTALLCGILALAARFASTEDVRSLGPKFATQMTEELKHDLETVSLSRTQAWVLAGNVAGADSSSTSESLFFGIAIRSAHILKLGESDPDDGAVLRETKSRTWWTLYMIDRWSSAGLGTPRQLGERQTSQRLPLGEYEFHNHEAGQEVWTASTDPGLWAYMILLAELFGPIQDLNRLIASGNASEQYVSTQVAQLYSTLQTWQNDLPLKVRLNNETLAYHKSRGHGRTFVALHLGYFHYTTLLFFHFLDQSSKATPNSETYAERCRQHASAFSDLLKSSYNIGECEVMYTIVGHMAVVSSSVLIHTLLFGNEEQLPGARRQLESNFKILMRLKSWWPNVGQMTERLFLFQRACLRNVDAHTHKIDRWMVKFLLEHAITLSDKSADGHLDSTSPQDFSSSEVPEMQRLSERGKFTKHALSGLRA